MDGLLMQPFLAQAVAGQRKVETRRLSVRPGLMPGKQFFVREQFRLEPKFNTMRPLDAIRQTARELNDVDALPLVIFSPWPASVASGFWGKLRPGIHLPQALARSVCTVEDVRWERLHEIDDDGAVREGFVSRNAFQNAWVSMYGWLMWDDNPPVAVISFSPTP